MSQLQKIPFVLASTAHGPMILSVLDYKPLPAGQIELGVGAAVLINGSYDLENLGMLAGLLEIGRQRRGDGVVMIDGGANIGTFSVEFGRFMDGWGRIYAYEPQERVFYALCGNVAINNLFNVECHHKALGSTPNTFTLMRGVNYQIPANLGGVDLAGKADIGQSTGGHKPVALITIDELGLSRLDLLKLDVEGMEVEVLAGAEATIARCQPFIFAEWIKCGEDAILAWAAAHGYDTFHTGMNLICAPYGDEVLTRLRTITENAA